MTMRIPRWLLSLLVAAAVAVAEQQQQQCESDGSCQQPEPECGVYMAPSTIGEANLGIYTGFPLKNGDVINFPEIVVPLMFRSWADHGEDLDGSLWDRYIWDGHIVHVEPKDDDLDRDSTGPGFIPGVGCTINSRLDLKNIESTHGSIYDTAGLHRSKDPGAGAFSPYHSSKTVAVVDIPAGSEIFAEYGSEWIPDIPGAIITFDDDMDKADEFLEEYGEWMQSHDLTEDLAQGLWDLTVSFRLSSNVMTNIPSQPWNEVAEKIGREESVVRYFLRQHGERSLEWLKEHGKCQDHIKPGLSTIPQAGRGAFASRNLPKGTVVGYSPLIHMADNRKLWDIPYSKGSRKKKKPDYVQQDLILNYSFGHRNSTLLLTPYGAMVNFINHDKERANVKVQWPSQELVAHNSEWLTKDIHFLRHTIEKIGVSFDYVALRDIGEGEEIFMDYGEEWQAAWDEHVRTWEPPPGADKYVHASEWRGPLLTEAEEKETPYPPNLMTLCTESYSRDESGGFVFVPALRETAVRVHCSVVDRTQNEGGEYTYTVRYRRDRNDTLIVKNVPKDGVELVDRLKTADWHMQNAFRHEIMIPDDIFPESWKNR
jgi:hypothetical protein